ncbi:hypothetical protein VPARA_43300 [Variovorax paradoxus]|uniref:C4-dicarboxylate transporter DctA n=1 Tax=Variovorax paradoxus TaxID=34073 RepID=A0A0H2LW16_VARPD|nr:hypothetical protein VPARA_43300 [Variovorax paradoxus]
MPPASEIFQEIPVDQPSVTPKPFYKSLYFQVITAIVLGVLLGCQVPPGYKHA